MKHQFQILNPEIEINEVLQLRKKLDQLGPKEYMSLLEHPNSTELIADLHQFHQIISQSRQNIRFLFQFVNKKSVNDWLDFIDSFINHLPLLSNYLPEVKKWTKLPSDIQNWIKNNPLTVNQLTYSIFEHYYFQKSRFNPIINEIEPQWIEKDLVSYQQNKNQVQEELLCQIKAHKKKEWEHIEQLLNQPSSKLNEAEKIQKKEFKTYYRQLIHELGKQQRHLALKQWNAEDFNFFLNLQPIWMMNPLSVSENLPLVADLFDVVIFDEASQIPLEDAIPSVYRAKKMVVVGDSKQMPPTQFFSSKIDTLTLLHQSEMVFKSGMLHWHYRSHHPALINFSNRYFYENDLLNFPASVNEYPIEYHYLELGVFNGGVNLLEAKKVAQLYSNELKNGNTSVGIVAFSLPQQKAIEKEISALKLNKNETLFVRNLENIQGDEKDVIIISIGYGFNTQGQFNMQFGPINQSSGPNRLNVLFSRAKSKMIVVTSVKSTDFKWSDNRGVQLLQSFLSEIENPNSQQMDSFLAEPLQQAKDALKNQPHIQSVSTFSAVAVNALVDLNQSKILLINPGLNNGETKDVTTLLNVIYTRFKKVKVILSKDYLNPKGKSFETDVVQFFQS